MKRIIICFFISSTIFQSCSFSAEALLEKAKTLMGQNKFHEAIDFLNKAINADDQNHEAFNTRGVAYFELKEFTNASLDYDRAIQLKPDFYRPYYNRALLKIAQNNTDGALKDFAEAIKLNSKNAEIYVSRGQLLAALNQTDAALIDFREAVKYDTHNAAAWYNQGNLLFQRELFEEAVSSFQTATKNDPSFGKAFHALGIAQLMQEQKDLGCLNLKQAQKLGYTSSKVAIEQYCQ